MPAPPSSFVLIHPPAVKQPPMTRSEMAAFLSAMVTVARNGPNLPDDNADNAAPLLQAIEKAARDHHADHCVCRSEIVLPALVRLVERLTHGPSGLRLSLACRIGREAAVPLPLPDSQGRVVQIQWRATQWLPEASFFSEFSKTGIWNHLILDDRAATPTNRDAVVRQPGIVHSWEAVGNDNWHAAADDGYRRLPPLPGRPLWQAVADPDQRFVLIDRFGRNWYLRTRVDDDGERLFTIGEALTYHFCPPDRLPAGYLDLICDMVAAGGTVAATHVRSNLEKAHLIGYVLENDRIVGNSSLKNPRPEYIAAVRKQSGLDLSGFVERGYTSVRPEYRGLGIGTRLLAGLTERAGDRKIFSVIAEDNHATKVIARRNNTRQVATYFSEKAGKAVGIWMPAGMIDADRNGDG